MLSQFLVIKKSYLSTISLAVGAGSNVLLNFLLIPKYHSTVKLPEAYYIRR